MYILANIILQIFLTILIDWIHDIFKLLRLFVAIKIFLTLLILIIDAGRIKYDHAVETYIMKHWKDLTQVKCKACKLTPPLRAYHCSICQACITRYEFHSILFMTCIGARNSVPYIIFWINEILDCIGIFSLLIINISHDFGDHIGPLIIFAIFFAIYTKVVIDCLWSAIRSMAENLTYNER